MPSVDPLETRYQRLRQTLTGLGSALVAYSGGVDSTLLLATAVDALGDRAAGAIADSPSLPRAELAAAADVAAAIGATLFVVPTAEGDLAAYRANGPDRCYHCKRTLFVELEDLARREGFGHLLYGAIPDDAADHRPGHRAARELSVRAPLVEVDLAKDDIRRLSRRLGLATWDKPSTACLASRVPTGTEVTPRLLARIEAGEAFVRRLGFGQVRLRDHGPIARLELDPAELPRATEPGLGDEIARALAELGWLVTALDLSGYRTGSLHRAAAGPARGDLDRLEDGRAALARLGLEAPALCDHGPIVRLILDRPAERSRAARPPLRDRVVETLAGLGWPFATLDLIGRS